MQNLHEIYNLTIEDRNKWDYYEKMTNYKCLYKIINESKIFIEEYLKHGGKLENNPLAEVTIDEYRYQHIISSFFLGIYLYNNVEVIKNSIDKIIENISDQIISKLENYQLSNYFPYLWYLTCLFHDLGYYYEKNLQFSISNFNINNCPSKFIGVPECVFDLWQKYFFYIFCRFNKFDHGVTAGIILYDYLIKRYQKLRKKNNNRASFIDKETGLFWSKKLIEILHLHAVSAIITHNMWIAENSFQEKKIYNNCGLSGLIIPQNSYFINVNDHPFLFLLGLVDTLEPIKLKNSFSQKSNNNDSLFVKNILKIDDNKFNFREITKSYYISLDHNKISIKVEHDICYDLYKNIDSIKNWLKINISKNDNIYLIEIL